MKNIVKLIVFASVFYFSCSSNDTNKNNHQTNDDTNQVQIQSNPNLRSATNSSLVFDRNTAEFQPFLAYFIATTFSNKNFDSLLYVSSPILTSFIDNKIGFGRFWNMGAACELIQNEHYGYPNQLNIMQPEVSKLKYYENKSPEGGFCEDATSPDGIYFQTTTKLPESYDMMNDISVPAPKKYNKMKKMSVDIQYNKKIIKSFYFVQDKGRWYLLYIYDCDCGA